VFDSFADHVQHLLPAVSLVGSAASVGITSYGWLVKMNRERANLQIEGVDHVSHVDFAHGTAEEQWLNFRLGLVVVNNSTLPNAVLGTTVKVMPRGSGSWQPVEGVRPARGSAFPVNLPALQSGLLTLEWEMRFPALAETDGMDRADDIVAAYLTTNWKLPDRVTVEVRGLQGKSFTGLATLGESRMSATLREHFEMTSGGR
jgi:hypothetical protein